MKYHPAPRPPRPKTATTATTDKAEDLSVKKLTKGNATMAAKFAAITRDDPPGDE